MCPSRAWLTGKQEAAVPLERRPRRPPAAMRGCRWAPAVPVRPKTDVAQAYCVFHGHECVFRPRRKPGPRGGHSHDGGAWRPAAVSDNQARTLHSAVDDAGNGVRLSRSTSPSSSSSTGYNDTEPAILLDTAQAGLEALSQPPLAPAGPVQTGPPLPPQELLNYLVSIYISELYPLSPLTIKSELLRELTTPGEAPDFYVGSMVLGAWCWHAHAKVLAGNEQHRTAFFHSLHSRLMISLRPVCDHVFGGPYLKDGRLVVEKSYFRTAVRILITLFNLAAMSVIYPAKSEGTFEAFRSSLNMALAVVNAAQLRRERLYGHRLHPRHRLPWRGDHFSPEIERFRRTYWAFVAADYAQSAIYQRDPILPWLGPEEIRPPEDSDEAYEAVKQAMLEKDAVLDAVCDTIRAEESSAGDRDPMPLQWPFATGDGVPTPLSQHASDDIILTAPLRTAVMDGKLIYPLVNVRLAQLASLVAKYRRTVSRPFLDRPGLLHLEAQLEHCISELPHDLIASMADRLDAVKPLLGTDRARDSCIQYLGIMCLLHSPAESSLWNSELDPVWLQSTAFVRAQESAVKTTEILTPLVEAQGTAPHMCLPFFQYCVIRTGLMHLAFLKAAERAGQSDSQQAAEARAHIAIHSAALRKAQLGIGAERKSWWFEAWSSVAEV